MKLKQLLNEITINNPVSVIDITQNDPHRRKLSTWEDLINAFNKPGIGGTKVSVEFSNNHLPPMQATLRAEGGISLIGFMEEKYREEMEKIFGEHFSGVKYSPSPAMGGGYLTIFKIPINGENVGKITYNGRRIKK